MKLQKRHRTKTYFEPSTILLLKQVGIGFLVLSVMAVVVALIWWGTRLPLVTIKDVNISGGYTISHDFVRTMIETELGGSYIGIVPKRFTYFYPEEKVLNAVAMVPRIKDIEIFRDGTTLRVSFDEFVPEALWCNKTDDSNCLFLDSSGYAFAPAPALQGGSLVRYYSTESLPEVKRSPFSQADYDSTKKFIKLAEEIGWYIGAVEINQARDVFYLLSQGGELKATLTDDPAKPFDNLRTILNSKEFSHLKPGNFQYLDLRFGTRVFVNEELPTLTATTTATSTELSTTTSLSE